MAFSQSTKDCALQHFIEGKPPAEIASLLNVPLKTIYNWKSKGDWTSYLRIGNMEVARNVEMEIYKLVQKMCASEQFGNPADVDKLAKLTKALDRLSPNRQILNSLFRILEGITDYVNRSGDIDLTKVWQKHLKPLSTHLKNVFSAKE